MIPVQAITNDQVGAYVFKSRPGNVNLRDKPTLKGAIIAVSKTGIEKPVALFAGDVKQADGIYWYKITLFDKRTGWVGANVTTLTWPIEAINKLTPDNGKDVLRALITNDWYTFHILIALRRQIELMKAKGKNVNAYIAEHDKIFKSVQARKNQILSSDAIKVKQGVSSWYNPLVKWWQDNIKISGTDEEESSVNAVPVAVVMAAIAVGVIIIAISSVAIYNMFHTPAGASTIDLSKATTLANVLKNIDEPTRNQVIKEIDGQLKDVYYKGKSDSGGPFDKLIGNFSTLAIFGVAGYLFIKSSKSKK